MIDNTVLNTLVMSFLVNTVVPISGVTSIPFQNTQWVSPPFLSHYKSDLLKVLKWAMKDNTSHSTRMGLGSAHVTLNWSSVTASGYTVTVGNAHWTVLRDHPYYTLAGLQPDRAYTAVITPVGRSATLNLSFSTPSLIPGNMYTRIWLIDN